MCLISACSKQPTLESNGGVVLVYEVEKLQDTQSLSPQEFAKSETVIRNRLDPRGIKGVTVAFSQSGQLNVGLPGCTEADVDRIKSLISKLGTLEFAIVANTVDHHAIVRAAQRSPEDRDDVEINGVVVAGWRAARRPSELGTDPQIVTRVVTRGAISDIRQFLVIRNSDDERVTGEHIEIANKAIDYRDGKERIDLTLNRVGARNLLKLTTKYRPDKGGTHRRLAILFDEQIHIAPRINEPISSRCQINGNFEPLEIETLIAVLNAGVLDVRLNPIPVSEAVIQPNSGLNK